MINFSWMDRGTIGQPGRRHKSILTEATQHVAILAILTSETRDAWIGWRHCGQCFDFTLDHEGTEHAHRRRPDFRRPGCLPECLCPHSKFPVGAALLTAAGDVFPGCNVENASYGLTVRRAALGTTAAVAAGQRQFALLAIASPGGVTPCGACRQVLAEFCPDLPILLVDSQAPDRIARTSLGELFPGGFASNFHDRKRPYESPSVAVCRAALHC